MTGLLNLEQYETLFSMVNEIKAMPEHLKTLLSRILDKEDGEEFNVLEDQANEIGYVKLINSKSSKDSVLSLLTYLPLFHKNVNTLKPTYFLLLKRVYDDIAVNQMQNPDQSFYKKCIVMFKLASIHPAFTTAEQKTFMDYEKRITSMESAEPSDNEDDT